MSNHRGFQDILQVFSRFFIDPLFDEGQIDKEIEAVDSEYINSISNPYDIIWNSLSIFCDGEN